MKTSRTTEYVHEGRYVAEVEVALIETGSDWSPQFSLADANKIDDVRQALKSGDLKAAGKLARVYEMVPVAAE